MNNGDEIDDKITLVPHSERVPRIDQVRLLDVVENIEAVVICHYRSVMSVVG